VGTYTSSNALHDCNRQFRAGRNKNPIRTLLANPPNWQRHRTFLLLAVTGNKFFFSGFTAFSIAGQSLQKRVTNAGIASASLIP